MKKIAKEKLACQEILDIVKYSLKWDGSNTITNLISFLINHSHNKNNMYNFSEDDKQKLDAIIETAQFFENEVLTSINEAQVTAMRVQNPCEIEEFIKGWKGPYAIFHLDEEKIILIYRVNYLSFA